jgi:hypothetical protein
MNDYCPGAIRALQAGGVTLDTSLPPRAVWHITWDALVAGKQPAQDAVDSYLQRVGYCPHILWNPFTGEIKQYYPASVGARALKYNNQDGKACIQIEVFFTPNCIVDGVQYATVADTPCKNLDKILEWPDSLGIPRVWPMGPPTWNVNLRDVDIWNAQAGHYGHCNSPGDDHTDPGPMPSLGKVSTSSTVDSTSTNKKEDEDYKMLFLMQGADDTGIWIGDGVVRRAIPNETTLNDILYRYKIGELKLANNGKIIKGNVDLCGKAI